MEIIKVLTAKLKILKQSANVPTVSNMDLKIATSVSKIRIALQPTFVSIQSALTCVKTFIVGLKMELVVRLKILDPLVAAIKALNGFKETVDNVLKTRIVLQILTAPTSNVSTYAKMSRVALRMVLDVRSSTLNQPVCAMKVLNLLMKIADNALNTRIVL